MTRAELRVRMTAAELLDWEVLELVDPWGQAREDWRFARLAIAIMHSVGAVRKDKREWFISDFLPPFPIRDTAAAATMRPAEPVQSVEYIEAMLTAWMFGANEAFAVEARRGQA